MSDKGYTLETSENTFTTRSVGIEIGFESHNLLTCMGGAPGDPRVTLPTGRALTRAEWEKFKSVIDEAFDLFNERWPK